MDQNQPLTEVSIQSQLGTTSLYFAVLPKQTQELSGVSKPGLSSKPGVCQGLYSPHLSQQGWLGWFHTMALCRLWQPIPAWGCWAILGSWGWVHSWAGAVGVFPLGQSWMSRKFLQTDFLIVHHNCTRGKGNTGDLEHFFFSKKNTDSSSSSWN